jgi:hypothetical protein
MDILSGKVCSKCKEWKPFSEFGKSKTSKYDGLRCWCKDCSYDAQCKYRANNRDKVNQAAVKWRKENTERARELEKARYAKNPEKYREKAVNKRNNNLEKFRGLFREWRANNLEKALDATRRWRKNNPEKVLQNTRNRRARKKAAGGRITAQEWAGVLERYGRKCLYPGCNKTDIQMDHVMPLVMGGTHTKDNVQPLCSFHNSSKGDKYADYRR